MKKRTKLKKIKNEYYEVTYHPGLAILRISLIIFLIASFSYTVYYFLDEYSFLDRFSETENPYIYKPNETINNLPKNVLEIFNLTNIKNNQMINQIKIIEIDEISYLEIPSINKTQENLAYLSSNKKGKNPYIVGEIDSNYEFNKFQIKDEMDLKLRKYLLYVNKKTKEIWAFSEINSPK